MLCVNICCVHFDDYFANFVLRLSGGYFGVISPEGAASILGRYKDAAHKARQFPLDCQELATAQCIYANQVLTIVHHTE